jgi:hypothetical protein
VGNEVIEAVEEGAPLPALGPKGVPIKGGAAALLREALGIYPESTGCGELDVSNNLPHLCPAEGGAGRLRGVRQADLSHLLGRLLVLEENYG